ncbi:3-deoxy-D-manno-octulosonic acid transferase [Wenzhouxiangella limi]|uniref:3-deoxy-D-manno-octulosonic acid transferase n=1 Tax=Wenzhouxiangella limi TaxID=2707351 RepID=A0A845UZ60_9GAMM|nr:3-deoxy-D-manno-octulosonic acid transferase [Wenzhouxiangella limi]NDY96018.1 3-deoxy-D-manno-octulosonic acid transferase [Wenzhouxiangella limi]
MPIVYRLLTLLLTPLALVRLQRGETRPGRWRERLGWLEGLSPGRVWIHAASVGEINAAQGLINALLERGEKLLISTMTVTGAERCRDLFGERVEHRYLALDNPFSVRAWLNRARPRMGLIIETEIWPELFGRCRALDIPMLMISARVSEPAMRRYRRFPKLFGEALNGIVLATCQTQTDAERLTLLGLPPQRIVETGNLKFDLALPDDLTTRAAALKSEWAGRSVWTAGSTRPGEEEILIAAHRRLLNSRPDALLVIAPRHPDRAGEIARLMDQEALSWCAYGQTPDASTKVVLVDRLGVLIVCYAASQVAFVGGSLVELGGHNLLEPAALARPVLAGPHLQQQAAAASALESTDGLVKVVDAPTLAHCLQRLFADSAEAEKIGLAAQAALRNGRGSLKKTLAALDPWL